MIGLPDLSIRAGDKAGQSASGEMAGMAAAFGGGGSGMIKMLAQAFGKGNDKLVRQDISRIYTLMEIARYTGLRSKAASAAGRQPGPEVSTGKLMASNMVREIRDSGLRMMGAQGMLYGKDAPMGGMIQQLALFSPAISIAGGSDQVQRNIIGERVLGLPSEPRFDKELPYKDLKVGTQKSS